MSTTAITMGGFPVAIMAKAAKRLTKKEARRLGEAGAFALHLEKLLAASGLTSADFAERCQAAGIDLKEYQVRSWLRGDSMPRAQMLRPLARVLKLSDVRHILPE